MQYFLLLFIQLIGYRLLLLYLCIDFISIIILLFITIYLIRILLFYFKFYHRLAYCMVGFMGWILADRLVCFVLFLLFILEFINISIDRWIWIIVIGIEFYRQPHDHSIYKILRCIIKIDVLLTYYDIVDIDELLILFVIFCYLMLIFWFFIYFIIITSIIFFVIVFLLIILITLIV
jgi:hypothetical protein